MLVCTDNQVFQLIVKEPQPHNNKKNTKFFFNIFFRFLIHELIFYSYNIPFNLHIYTAFVGLPIKNKKILNKIKWKPELFSHAYKNVQRLYFHKIRNKNRETHSTREIIADLWNEQCRFYQKLIKYPTFVFIMLGLNGRSRRWGIQHFSY